jgi:FkbM family methyltransferase
VADKQEQWMSATSAERAELWLAGASMHHTPLTTISSLIQAHGLARVDLLKVDVEGDEFCVLEGVRSEHWPLIKAVSMEVLDVHGRLR